MNIGLRLHDTIGNNLEEKLISARKQGFTCAHIAMQKVIPGFAMMDAPALLTPALADTTRGLLEKYEMRCAVLGCYLNLATPDPEALARTTAVYEAHVRFGKMIGADVVGTETGAPNTGYRTEPACFTEESLQLFISRLRPVIRVAEEVGQDFAIEPVLRHIVHTPQRAKQVLDAIDSPRLRIILDAVNLLDDRNAASAQELIAQSFDLFGDKISVLHMKDLIPGPGDTAGKSVACGLGIMDYTSLLTYAKQHEGIPMTLEDTTPDNAETARLHLEALAAAL